MGSGCCKAEDLSVRDAGLVVVSDFVASLKSYSLINYPCPILSYLGLLGILTSTQLVADAHIYLVRLVIFHTS